MVNAGTHPRKFLSAFTTLLFLNFLYAVAHFSIAFVNSSYLATFFSPETISLIYVVSAVTIIGALTLAPSLISRFGVWPLLLFVIPLFQLAIVFFGFATTAIVALFFFVVRGVLNNYVRYALDLYVETLSKDESKTGNTRSLYITAGNVGVLLGPIFASILVIGTNFQPLYAFSAVVLAPVFFIALSELKKITPAIPRVGVFRKSFRQLMVCHKSVRYTMIVNLMFQVWGVMIVVYAPLYLLDNGFSWQYIGSLIALAHVPYLVLEIPLGVIADRYIGEKELMIVGLSVLGFFTALLSIIPLSSVILWSLIFIATRIGAAMIEVSTESYFFKQVNETDSALISMFRSLLPLGAVLAPLIALFFIPITGLHYLFGFMGAIVLIGIPAALRIHDSR